MNKNDNKGFTCIECVIVVMVLLLIVQGFLSITKQQAQFSTTISATNYISRVISNQGGIQPKKPLDYNTEIKEDYITSSQLYEQVYNVILQQNEVIPNAIRDVEIQINGEKFTKNLSIGVTQDTSHNKNFLSRSKDQSIYIDVTLTYRNAILGTVDKKIFSRVVYPGYFLRNSEETTTEINSN